MRKDIVILGRESTPSSRVRHLKCIPFSKNLSIMCVEQRFFVPPTIMCFNTSKCESGQRSQCSDSLRAGRSEDQIPMGAR
jgi:hypothetical protein